MILYFLDKNLTILGKASNKLPNAKIKFISDVETQEVANGATSFSFTMIFDSSNRKTAQQWAALGNYILIHSNENDRAYTIVNTLLSTADSTIDIYAENVGLELINGTTSAYSATESHNIEWYINKFLSGDSQGTFESFGFKIGKNELGSDIVRKLEWTTESTISARLLSIATEFDVEISYSFTIDQLNITEKKIDIYKKIGKTTTKRLRMGKEISDIRIKKSLINNFATVYDVTGGTPESPPRESKTNIIYYANNDDRNNVPLNYHRSSGQKWTVTDDSMYSPIARKFVCTGTGESWAYLSYDSFNTEELNKHVGEKITFSFSVKSNAKFTSPTVSIRNGDSTNVKTDDVSLGQYLSINRWITLQGTMTLNSSITDQVLYIQGIQIDQFVEQETMFKDFNLYIGEPDKAEDPIRLDDKDRVDDSGKYRSLAKTGFLYSDDGINNFKGKINNGVFMRSYSYDTLDRDELFNRAVTDLKKHDHVETTYEVTVMANSIKLDAGDIVNVIDEAGDLYLKARISKVVNEDSDGSLTLTLSDYEEQ